MYCRQKLRTPGQKQPWSNSYVINSHADSIFADWCCQEWHLRLTWPTYHAVNVFLICFTYLLSVYIIIYTKWKIAYMARIVAYRMRRSLRKVSRLCVYPSGMVSSSGASLSNHARHCFSFAWICTQTEHYYTTDGQRTSTPASVMAKCTTFTVNNLDLIFADWCCCQEGHLQLTNVSD